MSRRKLHWRRLAAQLSDPTALHIILPTARVVGTGRKDYAHASTKWPRGFYLLAIDTDEARKALGIAPAFKPT